VNLFLSIWKSAESRYRLEPVDYLTAETIFDARCAMTLLDQAMTLLRQEYAAHGKASTFETLMGFLGSSGSNNKLSYEEAANVLGVGVGAVRTLIHRLRKQYTRFLRDLLWIYRNGHDLYWAEFTSSRTQTSSEPRRKDRSLNE
jgi:hypothetical protein